MWNEPNKETLDNIPKLYETENIPLKDKLVYAHFFLTANDWYICETDGSDCFWGFVILNADYQMSEWGYFSFNELRSIKVNGVFEIDNDLYWKVRKASEVEKICKGNHWKGADHGKTKQLPDIQRVDAGHALIG
jgi:hypothetical protein